MGPGLIHDFSVADTELQMIVNNIEIISPTLIDFMIFPKRIDKESLHSILLLNLNGIDGIHQVGVMKHDFGWFLRKLLSNRIYYIN